MKKQICVNIDVDVWIIAKQKLPNISQYLNECLRNVAGRTEEDFKRETIEEELQEITNSIQELSIKQSIAQMNLKILKEQETEKKKADIEREQFKRWKCGVCSHLNEMDNERCMGKCGLPTKTSSKTTIVYTNEVQ